MAVDMFLDLGSEIQGESIDKVYKDKIDILAWSFGVSQSGTMHMGSGGGAGKANFQDISFTKYIDKSSTNLMNLCVTGKHLPGARLVMRKAGGTQLEYLVYDLIGVMVSSVSTGGSGGEERLTENITLNFGAMQVTYTPQDETGADKPAVEFKYDIAKGTDADVKPVLKKP